MMRRGYGQRIHVFPQRAWLYEHPSLWASAMQRRSGRAKCKDCRATYDEHPVHPMWADICPTLVVACDGTPVKV